MEFPHLVQMHRKYGKAGLACVSVSVDPKDDKDGALKFLQSQSADFANFLLDDENWGERFDLSGPPAVFVFDRAGRRAARFDYSDPDKPFTYDDVEKAAIKLLKEPKP